MSTQLEHMKQIGKRVLTCKITGYLATVIFLLSGIPQNVDAAQTKRTEIRQKSNHHSKLGSRHVQRGDHANAEVEYRKAVSYTHLTLPTKA